MEEKQKIICNRCKCKLEDIDVTISYLGKSFSHKVPRCPACGQVYLPEELVVGKITNLEKALEEK